jgi:hypothetical protein
MCCCEDGANTIVWHPPSMHYDQIVEGVLELYNRFGVLCPTYFCYVAEKVVDSDEEQKPPPPLKKLWPIHDAPDSSTVDISDLHVEDMGGAQIASLAITRQGSLMLQKTLECDAAAYDRIREAFELSFAHLARHPHANYVLASLARRSQAPERIGWMLGKVLRHFGRLSKHAIGCRVISRLYENVPLRELKILSEMIMGSFDDLVCHRFGRYPVQCLVFTGDYRLEVVQLLSQDLPRYVTFRSSCRVIETAMEVGCTDDFVLAVRRAVADAPKSPTRSQKNAVKQHANT